MKKRLFGYIVHENSSLLEAAWKFGHNGKILCVVNDEQVLVGVCGNHEFHRKFTVYSEKEAAGINIGDVCNKTFGYIRDGGDNYKEARNFFAENVHRFVPVIDENGVLRDIFSRERAFYFGEHQKMPYSHYAVCMMRAAKEAKALGYDRISVIEFGVATGNGLSACEFHANEIEQLLGVEFDVYGMDTGAGLPVETHHTKDLLYAFRPGMYHSHGLDTAARFDRAKLIIGDIKDTAKDLIAKHLSAPIGAMLIDVDYYSSCVEVLKLLDNDDRFFLPRVWQYFDDVYPEYERAGEAAAIREFNQSHEEIYISSESPMTKIKLCHRLSHPQYQQYCGMGMTDITISPDLI